MGKWTDAAQAKKESLEAGQREILDRMAIQDENQLIIMEALADLGTMIATTNGGNTNG